MHKRLRGPTETEQSQFVKLIQKRDKDGLARLVTMKPDINWVVFAETIIEDRPRAWALQMLGELAKPALPPV